MTQPASSLPPAPAHRSLWTVAFGFALLAFVASLAALGSVIESAVDGGPRRAEAPAMNAVAGAPPGGESRPGEGARGGPGSGAATTPEARGGTSGTVAVTAPSKPLPLSAVGNPRGPADAALQAAIEQAVGANGAEVSVAVRHLGDGRWAALNADRVYYAASLFKLSLLFAAERLRSQGELDFDGLLQLSEEDIAEDLGTAERLDLDAEGRLPLRAALAAMIVRSDNAVAVAVLHLIGGARIDRELAALGLTQTSVNTRDQPTSAADMALLMEAVVRGQGIDAEGRERMRTLLLRQETRAGIPQGLPPGTAVGNKTGNWEGATHDVAFVDTPRGTYVIAVLTAGSWDWDPIVQATRAAHGVLSGR